jgi:hypothetical protein
MAALVELMNGIGAAVRRRVDFLHAPVPKPRGDDVYFAPLAAWRRPPEARLYLGLIHFDDRAGDAERIGAARLYLGLIHFDDRAGDAERIGAARRVVREFGVASECGWGRTDPARVPGLLANHRVAAEAPP